VRKRRRYDPEFKRQIIAASLQPGVSIAAVALANEINTNLLRRWVKEHREGLLSSYSEEGSVAPQEEPTTVVAAALQNSEIKEGGDVRLELRRGGTTVQIAWPIAHVVTLTHWLKDLLR
jgi:transposase-like protein